MDANDEIAALRRRVVSLERTVAELVKMLNESDVFAGSRSEIERRLAAAARRARDDDDDDASSSESANANAMALAATAYRGALPGTGGAGCAVCGKALGEDDPELSLPKRGRVCVGCFQRSSVR